MRGLGGYGGMMGMSLAGSLVAALGAVVEPDPFTYAGRRRRRGTRPTGWQDRAFQHPEGECAFRPTGSKRSQRRRKAQGK